ncbi:MAG: serine hydrolase [Rhodospirillaceae bacterium]|nr:serine hydrolase [Rhodospirillaceae bacterium]MCY4311576.1 serine hydrolase [Rhodospirillaceae bacterium]
MLRTLIAAVVIPAGVLATAGGPVQAQRVNNDRTESFISATKQAQVEAIARGFMRRRGIKGLSMAVGRNGKLLIATGFGEARPGLPSGKNTIYPIGKISQQFTAAALLWWQDRKYRSVGIVRVNDPVSEYFFGVAHWQGMKLAHLLTHTSGLPQLAESVFFQERLYSSVKAEKILDFVKGRELAFRPGSQFRQSHSNYFLIAQIIEVGLEVFFQDYIKTEIFALNEMTKSGFIGTTSLSRRAQGYIKGKPSKEVNPTMFFGSADATSTAIDLVKFDRQLMRGQLFSAAARAAMFGKHIRVDRGLWYGAGWFIRDRGGREEYFSIGDLLGFTSINKIYRNTEADSDHYVVVLTNADKIRGLEVLADRLLAAMK